MYTDTGMKPITLNIKTYTSKFTGTVTRPKKVYRKMQTRPTPEKYRDQTYTSSFFTSDLFVTPKEAIRHTNLITYQNDHWKPCINFMFDTWRHSVPDSPHKLHDRLGRLSRHLHESEEVLNLERMHATHEGIRQQPVTDIQYSILIPNKQKVKIPGKLNCTKTVT